MNCRTLPALCLPWLVAATPAQADAGPGGALDEHWPPGADVAIVVSHPNAWAEAVDAIDQRFGDVPAVRTLVEKVRKSDVFGLHPAARDWGRGLDLDRGLAWFRTPEGQRLVAGSREAAAAESSLRALHLLEPMEGLAGQPARCSQSGAFLVCETGKISGRAPAPAGAAAPSGALAWLWMTGKAAEIEAPGVLVDSVTGWLTHRGEDYAFGFQGHFRFDPAMKAMPVSPERIWSVFTPKRAAAAPSLVDESVAGALKLDFDFPGLVALSRDTMGEVPGPFVSGLKKLEGGLTGEMVMTFDGSIAHPVFLLGLAKGAAGDQVLGGLAELAGAAGARASIAACPDASTQTCLELAIGEAETTSAAVLPEGLVPATSVAVTNPEALVYFTFHTARVGDTLVLGTTAADVARRQASGFRSKAWPPALSAPGTSGLLMPSMTGFAGVLGAQPFFRIHGEAQWVLDAELLMGLMGAVIESSSAVFRAEPGAATFELVWRTM